MYEIYSASTVQSSNEYLCTVCCGITSRDGKVLHAPDFEAVTVDSLASSKKLAEETKSEEDWVEVKVSDPSLVDEKSTYKDRNKLLDSATGKPSISFDHGAGHVDPVSALDPELVYDLTVDDYIGFLCALKKGSRVHSTQETILREVWSIVNRNNGPGRPAAVAQFGPFFFLEIMELSNREMEILGLLFLMGH